ncbi:O-antigen ligase family protein [Streptomyces marincola]|uniref:O-antigen ligase-related domain-containing protein n=1 Tax=Streptomyces marincola TaxID=2878388 RepID=A0A1W7D5S3_9ACTN|nr:O-antigen ligase family protein [Streptomyces marincola]ARQ72335.1 hypothetical protein CAG99_13325 [Streptomyces marincola]
MRAAVTRVARGHGHLLPPVAVVLLLSLPGRLTFADTRIAVADLASLGLAAACATLLARGHRPRPGRRAAVVLAAPALALAAVTMASGDPLAALPGFVRFLQLFVLVPLAVLLLLRGRRDARVLLVAVVALALFQGALGTAQHLTGTGASYMGENVRAVGTFGPLTVMGMATVVSYGLVAALCLGVAAPVRASWWRRLAALACAALLAPPLAFSFSRGAWLATAVAVLAVLVIAACRLTRRTLLALLAGGVLLAGGAVAAGGAAVGERLGERVGSIRDVTASPDQSVTDRYAMWDAALSMWRDDPWLGTGPRGFAEHRDSHASLALSGGSDTGGAGEEFRRQELESPHNMYLLVLAEQGLVGATALVGGWAALLACCLARLRRTGAPDVGLAATGLLVWQAVNFLYADIGGPHSVLTAVALGLGAWWAFSPAARREAR